MRRHVRNSGVFLAVLAWNSHANASCDETPSDCSDWANNGAFLPHPCDCAKFYQCSNYDAVLSSCGPGTYYDPESFICQFDNTRCHTTTTAEPSTTQLQCDDGYVMESNACVDINECAVSDTDYSGSGYSGSGYGESNDPCQNGQEIASSHCINLPGTYVCCPITFTYTAGVGCVDPILNCDAGFIQNDSNECVAIVATWEDIKNSTQALFNSIPAGEITFEYDITSAFSGPTPDSGNLAELNGAQRLDPIFDYEGETYELDTQTRTTPPTNFNLGNDGDCGDMVNIVRSQQNCGSCWAFAAVSVAQDAVCLQSGGVFQELLSPLQGGFGKSILSKKGSIMNYFKNFAIFLDFKARMGQGKSFYASVIQFLQFIVPNLFFFAKPCCTPRRLLQKLLR